MSTRTDRITTALELAQHAGHVSSWYSYAPGDGRRRWVVATGALERTYTTREAEAFVHGLEAEARASVERETALADLERISRDLAARTDDANAQEWAADLEGARRELAS